LFPDLLNNPEAIADVPPADVPALLAMLASLQSAVASRLLQDSHPVITGGSRRDTDQLLTVQQAAERLCFKPPYLYGLIRQGKFPAIYVGRHPRIRPSDLEDWLGQPDHQPPSRVDEGQYATYNSRRDRRRTPSDSQTTRAYAARIRGPRRRRAELDSAAGEGGNRYPRAVGPADPDSGGAET
jgi:excisionase family DNA binding protein